MRAVLLPESRAGRSQSSGESLLAGATPASRQRGNLGEQHDLLITLFPAPRQRGNFGGFARTGDPPRRRHTATCCPGQ